MSAIAKHCFACDYNAETNETKCPECGGALRSSTTIRMMGGAMAFFGLTVVGILGWAVVTIGSATRTGPRNASFDNVAYAIIVGVFAMGGIAIITGFWHLITGRRNLVLVRLLIGIGFCVGMLVMAFNILY